jgi:hypothetical protein
MLDQVVEAAEGQVDLKSQLIAGLPNVKISSRGCIFSHVQPFYERAVSDLGP